MRASVTERDERCNRETRALVYHESVPSLRGDRIARHVARRALGSRTRLLALPVSERLRPAADADPRAGSYTHPASRLEFPEDVAGFRRGEITQFDANGENLGVGYDYETADATIAFTVYVRRPLVLEDGEPESLGRQFAVERQLIRRYHQDKAEIWSLDVEMETDGRTLPGYAAEFRYNDLFAYTRHDVVSFLYLCDRDGWFVKYRSTYAEPQDSAASAAVARLLATAPWGPAQATRLLLRRVRRGLPPAPPPPVVPQIRLRVLAHDLAHGVADARRPARSICVSVSVRHEVRDLHDATHVADAVVHARIPPPRTGGLSWRAQRGERGAGVGVAGTPRKSDHHAGAARELVRQHAHVLTAAQALGALRSTTLPSSVRITSKP